MKRNRTTVNKEGEGVLEKNTLARFYDPDGVRSDIIDQIVAMKDKPLAIRVGSRQVTCNGPSVNTAAP